MYHAYYGLAEKPFNPTPDPRFLFLSDGHREALAQLQFAVADRRGFLLFTGDVGTGKTTLVRTLVERVGAAAEFALVFDSTLPFDDLLDYVLEDFGIRIETASPARRLVALNRHLTELCRAGKNAVLVIDEAQNLDVATLERVRLLSNFETPREKILQILLVGQPELDEKLRLPELRQLRQRIGLRARVGAFGCEETHAYVAARLRVAKHGIVHTGSGRDGNPFTPRAIDRVHEYSGGIPRVVNVVCDHCMVIGYADRSPEIDRPIVEEAIAYLEGGEPRPAGAAAPRLARGSRRRFLGRETTSLRWATALAIAATLVLAFGMLAGGASGPGVAARVAAGFRGLGAVAEGVFGSVLSRPSPEEPERL